MSYAGPKGSRPPQKRPRPSSAANRATAEADWRHLAIFGAGLALGITLGASAALLTAPQTGSEARTRLMSMAARKRRALTRRGRDAFADIGDELRDLTTAIRRRKLARQRTRNVNAEAEAPV